MKVNTVLEGDCLEVMKTMPNNCIDTIITDPPYGLEFMGKNWDYGIPGIAYWKETLRVAKPGATLIAFGGTRTHHRLMCAIEDAGWEIRDCINYLHDGSHQEQAFMASLSDEQLAAYLELHYPNKQMAWVYGSGFPKSLDVSKAIDKQALIDCSYCNGSGISRPTYTAHCLEHGEVDSPDDTEFCPLCYDLGLDIELNFIKDAPQMCINCEGIGKVQGAEREVVGKDENYAKRNPNGMTGILRLDGFTTLEQLKKAAKNGDVTPYGRCAKKTLLRCQREIVEGGNITAPATPLAKTWDGWGSALKPSFEPIVVAQKPLDGTYAHNAEIWGVAGLWIDGGRIEANELITTHSRGNNGAFPKRPGEKTAEESGQKKDQRYVNANPRSSRWPANVIHDGSDEVEAEFARAGISKSPFSYKRNNASESTGVASLVGIGDKKGKVSLNFGDSGTPSRFFYCAKSSSAERGDYNTHPTVKPLELIKYLCRLTKTPTGGLVLDPFAGSGTTALAAIAEGRNYILIEKEPEYVELCKRRIAEYTGQEIAEKEISTSKAKVNQLSLW